MKLKPPPSVEKRFPTKKARDYADTVIDHLPETLSMTSYIDAWIAAYKSAGGR